MANFGTLIQEARKERQLTVRALAEAIGKSPGYISRIEVGGEIPSVEVIVGLAQLLGEDIEKLLSCAKDASLERATIEVESKYRDALALHRKRKS